MPVQVAVLDDYQEVARELAPWEQLEPEAEITFFHDHLLVDGVVRDLLEGFEVVVAMRERTPFTAKRLASLTDLKLLVTTGMANAAIDMDAAREHGITVCGTAALPSPTAELAWGLIIGYSATSSRRTGACARAAGSARSGRSSPAARSGSSGSAASGGGWRRSPARSRWR